METLICLLRHGQTEWNKQGLIQGHTDNILNDTGKVQAKNIGKYLKINDNNWDIIISSPLKRAYETATIVANELGYNNLIIKNNDCKERYFGILEGGKVSKENYDKIFSENVEEMEKGDDLRNRATCFLKDIAKKYPNKRVLVATHSQFIKGAISAIDKTFDFTSVLKNTSLNYFKVIDETVKVMDINITSN